MRSFPKEISKKSQKPRRVKLNLIHQILQASKDITFLSISVYLYLIKALNEKSFN